MARCFGIIGGLQTGIKRCKNEGSFISKLYCRHHRLQPLWLLILLFSVPATSIYLYKLEIESILHKIKNLVVKVEPFREETFGILVAEFEGNTKEQKEKGKEVQHTITATLNARFKELGIHNTEARKISIDQSHHLETHKDARELGKNYEGTEIVIWGDITLAGVIPNITIVNPRSPMTIISQPEITLLKNTLLYTALDNIDEIRLPALTDEPTLLVLFMMGFKYFYESNYYYSVIFL